MKPATNYDVRMPAPVVRMMVQVLEDQLCVDAGLTDTMTRDELAAIYERLQTQLRDRIYIMCTRIYLAGESFNVERNNIPTPIHVTENLADRLETAGAGKVLFDMKNKADFDRAVIEYDRLRHIANTAHLHVYET
jgi:hypothetical protein